MNSPLIDIEAEKADHERRQNSLESQRNQGSAWNRRPHRIGSNESEPSSTSRHCSTSKSRSGQTKNHHGSRKQMPETSSRLTVLKKRFEPYVRR